MKWKEKLFSQDGFLAPRGAPTLVFGIFVICMGFGGLFEEPHYFKKDFLSIIIMLVGVFLCWLGATGRGY